MMSALAAQWTRVQRARRVVRLTPFDQTSAEGRSHERYRRIALNTMANLGTRAVGMAVSMISVPLTLRYLGKAEYGLWAAVTTFTTWVALFDFGVVNGLVNAVSEAHGRDDREAARRYVSTALALVLGLGSVVAIAAAIAIPLVRWSAALGAGGSVSERVVRWSVAAAVVPFLVSLPLSLVRQVYAGYQKGFVYSLFATAAALVALGGTVLAIRLDAGLPALIAIGGASGALGAGATFVYMARVDMPWIRPAWAAVSRSAVRRLLATSTPLFLFQIGALLVNESQILILAHRSGLQTVTDYALAMRLYLLLASFVSLGTNAFVPSFREAYERGDRGWLRRSFGQMLGARMALAAAAGVGLVAGGNAILRLWLRDAAVQFDSVVWLTLAGLMAIATWGTAFSELLAILDRIWVQVALVLVNGACTAGLTYVLAPTHGVLGTVVAGAVVPTLLVSWVLPLVARPLLTVRAPA